MPFVHYSDVLYRGSGGLIFGIKLVLNNAILELDENVDVVFIKEFYATGKTRLI